MAFPVQLSVLSVEEKTKIAEDLTITPKAPSTSGKFPFRSGDLKSLATTIGSSVAPPFKFLKASKEKDELRIPLFYATEMFGKEAVFESSSTWTEASFKGVEPRIELKEPQKEIIKEAMEHIFNTGCTTIQAQPGAGKTVMAIYIAIKLGLKTAILVPREPLVKQWISTIEKLLGVDEKETTIAYVPDQPSAEKKKFSSDAELPSQQFIVVLGERGNCLPERFKETFGTLIIDEAHMCCVTSWVDNLLNFSPRNIIALSATLERNDEAHRMMHLLAGSHDIFRPPTREYRLIPFQTNVQIEEKTNKITKKLDYTSFCSDLSQNETFNDAVLRIVVENPERKFIVLSKLVSQVKYLNAKLLEKGVKSDIMCGSRKSYKDCKVLIGTFSKISVGFDAATFSVDFDGESPNTLIFCHGVKEWQNYSQSVGRVMRASPEVTPVVVWMLSKNTITTKHLQGLKKYMCETGAKIERGRNATNDSHFVL